MRAHRASAAAELKAIETGASEDERHRLDTFEAEVRAGRAACTFEGRMVDAPVATQARQVIERHEALQAMLRRRKAPGKA